MPSRVRSGRSPVQRVLALFGAVLLLAGISAVTAPAALAEPQGFVTVSKVASVTTIQPGETFTYTLTVGCTSFGPGCTNAVLTDAVPAEFLIEGAPVIGAGLQGIPTVSGQNLTVTFTSPLSDPVGSIGLPTAATGNITITVRADPNLPFSASGIPVTNRADLDGTNTEPAFDTVDVTPIVPLEPVAGTTKSFTPDGALGVPGTPTTLGLTATNDSNGPVDNVVVTDPTDPAAVPNPFDYLEAVDPLAVTLPAGAETVQVDVWVNGAWVIGTPAATAAYPTGTDLAQVRGVRFTFASTNGADIPVDAEATMTVPLEQRDSVVDLDADYTVNNEVSATVGAAGETSEPATDTATYLIGSSDLAVGASKVFSPDAVTAGDPSTVTLTGTNGSSQPVQSLQIQEPSGTGTFDAGLTFDGMGSDGSGAGIIWPANATSAEIVYDYSDSTTSGPLTTATANTLPAPDPSKQVARFTVTFTGPIVPGASATIPFRVLTDPDQVEEELAHPNEITVVTETTDGASGSATAADTLTSYAERLAINVAKRINPAQILSTPGSIATVQLPAQLAPFPDSTTDATSIIVQDPQVVPPNPSPDPWWNSFDARGISQTAVPAGATLTIRYWDGTQWVVLPGAESIAGPTLVNIPIPAELQDSIQGLQFDYENPDGFPPGTSVQPNFSVELRDTKRDGSGPAAGPADVIENCASATATDGTNSGAAQTPTPCPTIELIPVTPGEGDLIEKTFLEPTPGAGKTVVARSGSRIDARLNWSTGGYSGLDQVVVSDMQDPETTPVGQSVFNAFDLITIPAITATDDPLLIYDAVSRVELWNGAAWVEAAADPCPAACDGTFPGVTLTLAEQSSTTGVRLVFVESDTNRNGTDPTTPQIGDGVARSIGNDRALRLTFQVRDEVRDPQTTPDPALGSRIYNQTLPGDVLNTARATGSTNGAQVVTDTDGDVVTIIDVPLNVDVVKNWTGGPLGIPPAGTPADAYPSGRISITATNATASRVDTLTITEPGSTGVVEDPFDVFDVKDIIAINVPPGASDTEVTLTRAGGATETITRNQALDLTAAQLADVVGIQVVNDGRIAAGGTGTLVLDARLRATHRGNGQPVTQADSPVDNTVLAAVDDLGGTAQNTPTADDDASITLVPQDISLVVGKSFTPAAITEPSAGPVTMTLTGQPGGSSRANLMTLTDDDPRIWNQYDFTGFAPGFSFTSPINQVQVDAFTGATYTAGPGGIEVTGGSWVAGNPVTSAGQLASSLNVAPDVVQGLRFTFSRTDGAIWENPATPTQAVGVVLTRRADLRTGGPVLTDLAGNQPAPEETAAGVASNEVDGEVQGAVRVNGLPIRATDDAASSVLYQHANNAVGVVKRAGGVEAGGTQPPATRFPYTMQVTNTGDVPIIDPVITDVLPSDASGPQLIFDPDLNPSGAGAFSYSLGGAAPPTPSGPAMPTDPAAVTTTVTGNVSDIRFTFPAGTVLEVGQSYTITVLLQFRPGLAGGTLVTNTFGITGDRPWDECSPGVLNPTTGACEDSTVVTVVSAGALRSTKAVKAVDGELGVLSTVDGAVCTPGRDGFYTYPCVPITKPGNPEIWRLTFANTGNLPIDRIVSMDELPTPGDTGIVNPLPRDSQWRPIFTGLPVVANAPAGTTVTIYYTTSATPCRQDLTLNGTPCPAGSWTVLNPAAPPAPGSVTAVKFEINFATPLPPLGFVDIDEQTTTPATSPTTITGDADNPIAWNSVAAGARTIDGGVQAVVPPTEGIKVGVAMATGPLSVRKDVTGDGAEFAPESFPLTVTCRSAVGTPFEQAVILGPRGSLTLAAGETATLENIPWGSRCTVAEDDAATTPSDFEATTVTVVSADQTVPIVIATNTYDLAGLTVTKSVDSAAVDQDGVSVEYGPFTVAVDCTFLGEAVYATDFGPDTPMTATLIDGQSAEFTGLPARSECTVTETDTKGASATSVTITQDGLDPVVTDTVSLLPNDPDEAITNDALVTNTFDVGSIELSKVETGSGAPIFGGGPYVMGISCVLDDASGSRTVWDGTVSLGGDDPLTATVDDIAAGAVCDVTELEDGGATSSSVDPSQLTVGAGVPAVVTVTNTFDVGSLVVTKVVDGDGAALYGAGPFEVSLACVVQTGADPVPVDVPGGPTRTVTADEPAIYTDLLVGATCRLTELDTGGATTSVISGVADGFDPAVVEVAAGDAAQRTVTNTFETGELRIIKELSGPGADEHASDTFTFSLACTREVNGAVVDIAIPGGATREVGPATDYLAVYSDLPVGASCEVSEIDYAGADFVQMTVQGESTTTDPDVVVPTVEFEIPATDPCQPLETINIWGVDGPAEAQAAAAEDGTDPASLDEAAGCVPPDGGSGGGGSGGGGSGGDGSGGGGQTPDQSGSGGWMASTGFSIAAPLGVAAVLILLGVALVVRTRRSRA